MRRSWETLQRWIDANKIVNPQWYVDRCSGKDTHRPQFIQLQADVAASKIDQIVIDKLDRGFRRLTDAMVAPCHGVPTPSYDAAPSHNNPRIGNATSTPS